MLTHSEAILHYNSVQGDVVIDLSPYGNNGIFYGGNIGSELDSGAVQINTALLDSDEPSVSGTGDLVEIQVKMLQTGSTTISFIGNNIFIGPENNDITILEKINGLVVIE
jgi:hypothetical protein